MSNNFLVRQIMSAGGSFFVGASIAIGTLSPIVLTSSRVLADSYQQGIPTVAASELQTLANQGINPKTIAFTPNGEWIVLYNNNSAVYYSTNIPQTAINAMKEVINAGDSLTNIAFNPDNGSALLYQTADSQDLQNFYDSIDKDNQIENAARDNLDKANLL